jgi:hypothetical protein
MLVKGLRKMSKLAAKVALIGALILAPGALPALSQTDTGVPGTGTRDRY